MMLLLLLLIQSGVGEIFSFFFFFVSDFVVIQSKACQKWLRVYAFAPALPSSSSYAEEEGRKVSERTGEK